jgi:16S rRNA (guanine527-N7)-methyltransferase
MASRDLGSRLTRRARRAGAEIPQGLLPKFEAYLELLARWNRRINLTALPLEPPTDETLDRLIIEPVVAARQVWPGDRLCLDLGSGGGSPGIPLQLTAPALRMVLVEVKVRKSAFLREVVRQLELAQVEVENRRFEELLSHLEYLEAADLVTIRAVRADSRLWNTIQGFLRPGGRALWFGAAAHERQMLLPPLAETARLPLVGALGSQLVVVEKQSG